MSRKGRIERKAGTERFVSGRKTTHQDETSPLPGHHLTETSVGDKGASDFGSMDLRTESLNAK